MRLVLVLVAVLGLLVQLRSTVTKQCGQVANSGADPFGLVAQLTGSFRPPVPREPVAAPSQLQELQQVFNPWLALLGRRRSLKLAREDTNSTRVSDKDLWTKSQTRRKREEPTLRRFRRIVGGYDASVGQICWQAKIHIGSMREETLCGGSIVGSRTVLIAAHCLFNEDTKRRVADKGIRVVAGGMNRDVRWPFRGQGGQCSQQFGVERSIVHPQYNYDMNDNDIAVLVLREPINFDASPCVCPICLVSKAPSSGEWCVVSGYGEEDDDGSNDRDPVPLKWTQLQVRPNVYDGTCAFNSVRSEFALTPYRRTNLDLFVCAGTQRWEDTCQGDSGGPLFCLDPEKMNYYLAGITSFGDECGKGLGGQYTKVGLYTSWIVSVALPGDVVVEN